MLPGIVEASGMRNSDGLFNDGLDDACNNNGQTTWTYNQVFGYPIMSTNFTDPSRRV